MKVVWEDEYRIHSYEVDSKGFVTLPMLCQFMQESAWNHAQHLGVGYPDLLEKNLLWVLARQLVATNFFPRWGETIRVQTWPTGKDRLFCYRDFKLLNERNHLFGAATTAWFVIDIMKRKPQRTDAYFEAVIESAEQVFSRKPTKIEPLNSKNQLKLVNVGYKDLDINEHVNNVRYVEWILESLPSGFQRQHQLKELEINYLAEARCDDTITLWCEKKQALSFLHSLRREHDGTELCRARSAWAIDNRNSTANLGKGGMPR